MLRYYIRLDDAHARMDLEKWKQVVYILDKFDIKAIIGVIPDNKDLEISTEVDIDFWNFIKKWQKSGHIIALHGLHHLKLTSQAGLVPKNKCSEFSGLLFEEQNAKIANGIKIFKNHGIDIKVFIPPFHSFDKNTISALKTNDIDILYDGIGFYPYRKFDILYFPQQYNGFKKKYRGIWSICLHPSLMNQLEIDDMQKFIKNNKKNFQNDFFEIVKFFKDRKETFFDQLFFKFYFLRRKIFLIKKRIIFVRN